MDKSLEWTSFSLTHVKYPKGDKLGFVLAFISLAPFAIFVSYVTFDTVQARTRYSATAGRSACERGDQCNTEEHYSWATAAAGNESRPFGQNLWNAVATFPISDLFYRLLSAIPFGQTSLQALVLSIVLLPVSGRVACCRHLFKVIEPRPTKRT